MVEAGDMGTPPLPGMPGIAQPGTQAGGASWIGDRGTDGARVTPPLVAVGAGRGQANAANGSAPLGPSTSNLAGG